MKLSVREKAILCGLYLAQHDKQGLDLMGFDSFNEAYNVLGLSIGAKPTSIKNYRDELDPLFPNARKGWRGRPVRDHCKCIYERFKDRDIDELLSLIIRITGGTINISDQTSEQEIKSFAKRLLTGRAAENFFSQNYQAEREFFDTRAEDVTHTGCGYDFRLHRLTSQDSFVAVEVKGLATISGNIVLTSKEYDVADRLRNDYFIYVVKNFNEDPFAITIRNPINTGLTFKQEKRKFIQISWRATV
ncbi:DUF3883 domain-containing protein [Candidatus Spongiihabitans sp.]|uniref:DUF3883 domain-containing protein n=1 Tax=Candidatus Spongiihabitans sp. TaxID=3101308 RepID=UPI003C7DD3B7